MEAQFNLSPLERAFCGRLEPWGVEFVRVPTETFISTIDLKMPPLPAVAMFTYDTKDGKPELLREYDQPYSPLALTAYPEVLIKLEDLKVLQHYAEQRILSSGVQKNLPVEKRMESLRRAALLSVEELFKDPSPENINRSRKVVGSFVYLLMRDPQAYLVLARLSSHDPYTLQHSVGAAVNSIILGKKIGFRNESDLIDIGMAGLLHDIGKVGVAPEIINKPGPLDDREWSEMRKHPEIGYEIIKDIPTLTGVTKMAVLEHHEEKHMKGYPNKIPWDDVGLYSKIVAIADIFNALTTERSYSKAKEPYEALVLIKDKLSNKIDDELFREMVMIYGGQLEGLSGAGTEPQQKETSEKKDKPQTKKAA